MRTEKMTFTGSGGETLAGRLDRPDGPVEAYALFAHCFTCTKDIYAATQIARALCAHGIGVLRFDFTGLGHSEGEFANTNFSSNVDDLVAAAGAMMARNMAAQILIGHSLGGAAVLAAAIELPEVRGVVTIGAPSDPAHVAQLFSNDIDTIIKDGEAEVSLAGRPFKVKKQFIEDIESQNLSGKIEALHRPLLILHAPRDELVSIDNAATIFGAAKHPKSFVSLDDADHLLTRRKDAAYVADIIASWAGRYIEPVPQGDTNHSEGVVTVAENGSGKFGQIVTVGRHSLTADEPTSVGGLDRGPAPYDYLLAALGACTSMTLRLYADRKNLPLERTVVHLTHSKIHAQDCTECETQTGKIDRIERRIELHGKLDEPTRKRLLEIADKCPVHQTLTRDNQIITVAANSDD